MPSLVEKITEVKNLVVTEVPAGARATLECNSNDYNHNFMFWILDKNTVIGPGNSYDERKYKYEVLSGKLHIDSVTPTEAGVYKCVSKKLSDSGLSVGEVEMIVKGTAFSAIDAVKLIAIVVSIIVIISCAVIYYRLRRERSKYDGHAVIPDSKSAIQHIAGCASGKIGPAAGHKVLSEMDDLITHGFIPVLQWVPSHIGLLGNEKADLLAKLAWMKQKRRKVMRSTTAPPLP